MASLFGTIDCFHWFAAFSLFTLGEISYLICFFVRGWDGFSERFLDTCSNMLFQAQGKWNTHDMSILLWAKEVGLPVRCTKVFQWEAFAGYRAHTCSASFPGVQVQTEVYLGLFSEILGCLRVTAGEGQSGSSGAVVVTGVCVQCLSVRSGAHQQQDLQKRCRLLGGKSQGHREPSLRNASSVLFSAQRMVWSEKYWCWRLFINKWFSRAGICAVLKKP